MRILSISGRNLASLAGDFTLDFQTSPLAGAGLFAISGPTGAGKSTLLDALCLALFDKTPRLSEGKSSYDIADGPERSLGVNDARNLLRRGAAEGFAQVEFEGSDGIRYRARWTVRRARGKADGALQNSSLELHNLLTGQPIGRTKGEILEATFRAIGLTFEQFRRSVLLAQGDFAAFLKAKADERAELLERMTGTEIYGSISKRAFERARDSKAEIESLEKEVTASPVLAAVERLELGKQAESLGIEVEARQTEQKRLQAAHDWYVRLDELQGKAKEAGDLAAASEETSKAAQARREAVAAIEIAEPLRPLLEKADDAAKKEQETAGELTETKARLGNAATAEDQARIAEGAAKDRHAEARTDEEKLRPIIEEARALDRRIAEKAKDLAGIEAPIERATKEIAAQEKALADGETKLADAQGKLEAAAAWLGKNGPLVALAKVWEAVRAQLQSFVKTQDEWKRKQSELPGLAKAAEGAKAKVESAQTAAKRATDARMTAEEKVRAAEKAEKARPASALAARRKAVEVLRRQHDELSRIRESATEADQARAAKEEESAACTKEAEELRALAKAKAAALEEVQRALEEQEKTRDRIDLKEHRAKLVPGEPCPLCGATEHPGVIVRKTVEALETQRRATEKRRQTLEKEQTEAETSAKERVERAGRAKAEVKAEAKEIARLTTSWKEKLADRPGPRTPLADEAKAWLSALGKEASRGEKELEAEEDAIAQLREAVRGARSKGDAAIAAEKEAQEQLAALQQELAEATRAAENAARDAKNLRANLEATIEALRETFAPRHGWQDELQADPREFGKRCAEDVKRAQEQESARDQATKGIGELQPAMASTAATLEGTRKALSEQTAKRASITAELDGLRGERGKLLGGRPADEIQAELKARLNQAEAALEQATGFLKKSEKEKARLEQSAEEGERRVAELRTATTQAMEALRAALSKAGIEASALRERLAHAPGWLAAEKAQLAQLERALHEARTRLAERERDLAAHKTTRTEDGDRESLAQALALIQQQLQKASQDLGAARQALKQDDLAREKVAGRQSEIESARRRALTWETLSKLIGSADGKRFRTFAQSLTLEMLLEHANLQLQELAPRYRLARVPKQDLELQVIDRDMGDEVRSTTSLSGGETFLVSLALALGLSSLASERVRIESLFVDEGFGSLDPQTLEVALATLDSLQASGRKVGLISHVPGLAERIGVQIRVEKQGNGRSTVEVIGAAA